VGKLAPSIGMFPTGRQRAAPPDRRAARSARPSQVTDPRWRILSRRARRPTRADLRARPVGLPARRYGPRRRTASRRVRM